MWIPAKELSIEHVEKSQHWKWISYDGCSLNDVAQLLDVHWLDIQYGVNLKKLHKTSYTVFFVFKLLPSSENLEEATACVRFAHEIVGSELEEGYIVFLDKIKKKPSEKGRFPQRRTDGWLEIKLGEFSNTSGNDDKIRIRLRNNDTSKRKSGLVVRGIDLRPNFICDCQPKTEAEYFFDCLPYHWYETPK